MQEKMEYCVYFEKLLCWKRTKLMNVNAIDGVCKSQGPMNTILCWWNHMWGFMWYPKITSQIYTQNIFGFSSLITNRSGFYRSCYSFKNRICVLASKYPQICNFICQFGMEDIIFKCMILLIVSVSLPTNSLFSPKSKYSCVHFFKWRELIKLSNQHV